MTCSYQDSIKHQTVYDFDKAIIECSTRENCTALRKNPCSFSSNPSYDFCADDPRALDETSTLQFGVPCIYKKVDPNGTYICIINYADMLIIFIRPIIVHGNNILCFAFQCLLKICKNFLPCVCLHPKQMRP